jgi:CelD/BcsL family acetyltransferase involved in cellulose biosynthesis
VIVRPQANFPYIELNDAWLEPDSQLSSRRRSDFRRALKRAQEYGDVRSEIIVPTLDDLDELLAIALDIEARSWKGEAGTALVHDPRRAEFFARYTRRACEQGILRMNFLHIGLDIAAMQIAVEQDAGLWLLKVGYDPEYARCSPGNLLIADTIRYAVDSGLKTYEFLGTSETWTRVWTEQEHETVSVRVYPASVSSAAVLLADACKVAASRLKQRFAR